MTEILTAPNTILIAEDDAAVRKFVSTILQDHGFHVIATSDAKQALTRARGYEGEINILLTDVEMGKLDEAEAKLELAMRQDPNNAKASYYLGMVKDARKSRGLNPPAGSAEQVKGGSSSGDASLASSASPPAVHSSEASMFL